MSGEILVGEKMSTSMEKKEEEEEEKEEEEEALSVEHPAPSGWKKKCVQKKGGTPKKGEIIFISPTGEEIANKRQLVKYLKAHLGNPNYSEFIWGRTGVTPRRSSRISEKVKAAPAQESEPPKKRSRKASASKKDDNKETETTAQENEEMAEEEKDEAEKTEKDKADVAVDDGAVKEDQTEKGDEGNVTNIEPKVEGDVVSMSNDAELLKKDAESSKPVTANVDGCEDQEISDVAVAEEQKHEAENEIITAPVPERVAENGSNIAEEQKHEVENEKITAPVSERVAENGSNIAEEQKHEAENEKMTAPVPESG